MTAVAFFGQFLHRYRPSLRRFGALRGIERCNILDFLVGVLVAHDIVMAGLIAIPLDCTNEVLRILAGEAWRSRVGAHAVGPMAAATAGGQRFTGSRIADSGRFARRRRLRGVKQRKAFQINGVERPKHLHRRFLALAIQIGPQGGDEVTRLLARKTRGAGGRAVAVDAVTIGAGRRGDLTLIVWRQDFRRVLLGVLERRQTGVIAHDIAFIRGAQLCCQILESGMRSFALFIGLQRFKKIFVHLCRNIRDAGGRACSVQAVTSGTLRFRDGFAGGDIRRHGGIFFRTTDHCQCQHDTQRKFFHYKSPFET